MITIRLAEFVSIACFVATGSLFLIAWASESMWPRRLATCGALAAGFIAAATIIWTYTGSLDVWLDSSIEASIASPAAALQPMR